MLLTPHVCLPPVLTQHELQVLLYADTHIDQEAMRVLMSHHTCMIQALTQGGFFCLPHMSRLHLRPPGER